MHISRLNPLAERRSRWGSVVIHGKEVTLERGLEAAEIKVPLQEADFVA
jgi:hypothetical protein